MSLKRYAQFPDFHEVTHPLLSHKLALLRDKQTSKKVFKELVHEITILLVYEATKDLPITSQQVETPVADCTVSVLKGKKPVILPILRAGIGMVDGFLTLSPSARVGHIGLYRDEATLKPKRYYFKIPANSQDRQFFVCDPMLATGGSACNAIDQLKAEGVDKITFVCLVAAPEGVENMQRAHPDVPIYAASLDAKLNKNSYIVPGLGDAGDRLFGTQ